MPLAPRMPVHNFWFAWVWLAAWMRLGRLSLGLASGCVLLAWPRLGLGLHIPALHMSHLSACIWQTLGAYAWHLQKPGFTCVSHLSAQIWQAWPCFCLGLAFKSSLPSRGTPAQLQRLM